MRRVGVEWSNRKSILSSDFMSDFLRRDVSQTRIKYGQSANGGRDMAFGARGTYPPPRAIFSIIRALCVTRRERERERKRERESAKLLLNHRHRRVASSRRGVHNATGKNS